MKENLETINLLKKRKLETDNESSTSKKVKTEKDVKVES